MPLLRPVGSGRWLLLLLLRWRRLLLLLLHAQEGRARLLQPPCIPATPLLLLLWSCLRLLVPRLLLLLSCLRLLVPRLLRLLLLLLLSCLRLLVPRLLPPPGGRRLRSGCGCC